MCSSIVRERPRCWTSGSIEDRDRAQPVGLVGVEAVAQRVAPAGRHPGDRDRVALGQHATLVDQRELELRPLLVEPAPVGVRDLVVHDDLRPRAPQHLPERVAAADLRVDLDDLHSTSATASAAKPFTAAGEAERVGGRRPHVHAVGLDVHRLGELARASPRAAAQSSAPRRRERNRRSRARSRPRAPVRRRARAGRARMRPPTPPRLKERASRCRPDRPRRARRRSARGRSRRHPSAPRARAASRLRPRRARAGRPRPVRARLRRDRLSFEPALHEREVVGVVTFSSRGSPSTTLTRPPGASTSEAQSVAAARRRSTARRSTSARNACGVCTATRSSRGSVSTTRSPATRLIVSATGSAGTTPSQPSDERREHALDHLLGQERPRRVVDEHDRRVVGHLREREPHRLGARLAAGDGTR